MAAVSEAMIIIIIIKHEPWIGYGGKMAFLGLVHVDG